MIEHRDWKWFGCPGHFICGCWCRFHLFTVIGPWMISTVGEYVHPRHSNGNERDDKKWWNENWPGEDIGMDRKYETMVFRAGKPCNSETCMCGAPEVGSSELDFLPANTRVEATENHMQLCNHWAALSLDEVSIPE